MNNLNSSIEAPQQSTGSTLVKVFIGTALAATGFGTGYFTDPDWDNDGVPNKIEIRCNMDAHNADSDGDGVRDGDDSYPLNPESAGYFSDTNTVICLTDTSGRKTVCFHPSDILLFELTNKHYLLYDWQADAHYVQENLTAIESMILSVGYNHYYRINQKELPNLLHVECANSKMDKLYLSREENIWCHVPQGKREYVVKYVNKLCDDDEE